MGSLSETIEKKRFLIPSMPYKDELPISSSSSSPSQSSKAELMMGIRKRISCRSFSVNLQPTTTCLANAAWAFRKSRSMPSLGEYFAGVAPLRRWWERSWGWLLSKKPAFAKDVEMNEEEAAILGCHSKGSLSHLFFKIRRLVRKTDHSSSTLPTTHKSRYDDLQ